VSGSPNLLWLVDRSSGEVTLLLLSVIVALGIVRTSMPRSSPWLIEGLHTNLALVAIAFAGVHVLAAVADPFARLGVVDALVPFVSAYRATWLGLGVISAYLYALAVLTSWPVRRLPRAAWLWLHRSMYLAWGLALVHSLATGSDARNQLFLLLDLVMVASVLVAFLGIRVVEGWTTRPALWAAIAVAAVLTTAGVGVWAFDGPLQVGWARISGTPPDLLGSPSP